MTVKSFTLITGARKKIIIRWANIRNFVCLLRCETLNFVSTRFFLLKQPFSLCVRWNNVNSHYYKQWQTVGVYFPLWNDSFAGVILFPLLFSELSDIFIFNFSCLKNSVKQKLPRICFDKLVTLDRLCYNKTRFP